MGFDIGAHIKPETWPDVTQPCWEGPALIFEGGRPQTTVRVLLTLIFDIPELHVTWRAQRLCVNPKCRNPHHHMLKLINSRSGTAPQPLPPVVMEMKALEIEESADELQDVVDTILMIDNGRDMTPAELCVRFSDAYTEEQFSEALAFMKERFL